MQVTTDASKPFKMFVTTLVISDCAWDMSPGLTLVAITAFVARQSYQHFQW